MIGFRDVTGKGLLDLKLSYVATQADDIPLECNL